MSPLFSLQTWRPFLYFLVIALSLPAVFHLATSILQYSLEIKPQYFSFGCHPLEGVTRGGPPPRSPYLVTPLDACASLFVCATRMYKQGTCVVVHVRVCILLNLGQKLVSEFNLYRVRNDVIWLVASCFRMFFCLFFFHLFLCFLALFFVYLGTIYIINK